MKNLRSWISHLSGRINWIFVLLLGSELVRFFYIVLERRIVIHDAFFRFTLQYYYLNNFYINGELPHWIPYMMHGTTAYWWHALQGIFNMGTYGLLMFGQALADVPYFWTYNIGVLLSRLLLLTGCWLLCGQLFRSRMASFIVCFGVMAACVSESQPYFNFYFYYALPLVIYLGHRFLDTGRWRYFVAALNLYAIQMLGNAAYFIPVTSFSLFTYFAVYIACHWTQTLTFLKNLHKGHRALLSLGLVAISFGLVYVFLTQGFHADLVRSSPGRTADNSVTVELLQQWAANSMLAKWFDLIIGISMDHDATLYIGALGLLFAVACGFNRAWRRWVPFAVLIVLLILFSRATIVTWILHEHWPLMKFYRHLYLILPFIRFWICFLAGFGFDALFCRNSIEPSYRRSRYLGIVFIVLGAAVFYVSTNIEYMLFIIEQMGFNFVRRLYNMNRLTVGLIQGAFRQAAVFNTLAGGLMLLYGFKCWRWDRRKFLLCLVLFHWIDMGRYGYQQIQKRTAPMRVEHMKILDYQPLPYVSRRIERIPEGFTRGQITNSPLVRKTVMYWSFNAFLFNDPAGSIARADHWMGAMDRYMRVIWNESFDQYLPRPAWIDEENFAVKFPTDNTGAMNMSGVTRDKIQFFRTAYAVSHLPRIQNLVQSGRQRGNYLLIKNATESRAPEPRTDDRLNLAYNVVQFDSNTLVVDVDNTSGGPAWMYYADVWHPDWRAWVNDIEVDVFPAQVAYKAIRIPEGRSQVKWRFFSPWIELLTKSVALNCAVWMVWLVGVSAGLVRRKTWV